jgi:hypothetical protein
MSVGAASRDWTDATFSRAVRADPAPVPLRSYLRFVDAPDVTAAAARHLQLTTYNVKVLGDDWYAVDNGDSTQGVYRVLMRDGGRRVFLSWGTHRGSILGTVGGSALTRLEFADDGGRAAQRLDVNVIIDQGLAAGLTRAIVPVFGWFVDRKLREAFRTASAAAAWAHTRPDEFCAWLGGALTAERRGQLVDVFDECATRLAVRPPR